MKPRQIGALAIACALAPLYNAHADDQTIEEIVVTAVPLGGTVDQLVRPAQVVSGEELDRIRRQTIGDTLENQPGLSTTDFGAGAGRPVIRGQGGPRVQVLENGIPSMDASDVSTDHAVSIDPAHADQVEVLKGPATLLYGGGASAGIVNVVDQRLPTKVVDGLHGNADAQYESNASATTGSAALGYGIGNQMFRAQYSNHDADDYDIPGWANTDNTGSRHTLANSGVWSRTGAISYGYIAAAGSISLSAGRFQTRYGLPVEETAFIDMNQDRYDVQGTLDAPTQWLESVKVRGAYNNYEHTEFEARGEPGTVFDNKQGQARVEAVHTPISEWRGVFGLQYDHRKFNAVGDEAFLPQSNTEGLGAFLIEQRPYSVGTLELGIRVQHDESAPSQGSSKDFTPISLAAGSIFDIGETYHLKVYATRTQRAPVAEELYAFGPHGATATFERGDDDLDLETANNVEIGLDHHGERLFWQANIYYQRIEDYISLQEVDVGLNADGSGIPVADGVADRVDDAGVHDPGGELLLVDYQQNNAEFYGFEVEATYALLTGPFALDARVFSDTVIGQLTNDTNLPRIPPARYGFGLDASQGPISGNVSLVHTRSQDDLGPLETPTNGYSMLTADLRYRLSLSQNGERACELFLQGRNLLDEEGRRVTSFLKDVAPLPGISAVIGLRLTM